MTRTGSRRLIPPAQPVAASLKASLVEHQLRAEVANAQEQLRGIKRVNKHLGRELRLAEDRFQALLALDGAQPATRFRLHAHRKTSESVACVQLTDWHIEERVRAASVNGLNRFDLRVAEQRVARLADKIPYLLKLNRAGTRIDTLVLQLGGDFMTGFIHMELIESNTLHPVQAVLWLFDHLCGLLEHLLAHSGCPQIICCCNVGNHGRTTEKKRISTRVENSYEWLLYRILAKKFPQIEWRVADGQFVYLSVFGALWRFQHGDDIKYQGGVGGISIPVNKAIAQWDKTRRADFDFFGHWHQSLFTRKWACNGSLIGYSAHSLAIKAEFEAPAQNFILWEKDHGRTAIWPIFLA